MGTEKKDESLRIFFRAYPVVIILAFLAVILLMVAFPRKRPLRDIVHPLTRFDAFFDRYGFFLENTLESDGDGATPLYRKFCQNPCLGGLRLEVLLGQAMDENAYCSPLLKYFIQESGAAKADRSRLAWAHDLDTASTCLAEPRPITYGGKKAQEIREGSTRNWMRIHPSLRAQVSELLGRSLPAASRFKQIRRSLGLEETGGQGRSTFPRVGPADSREAQLALAIKEAGRAAGEIDLSYAWLSLLYYAEGLDAFIQDMRSTSFDTAVPSLPDDDWFPEGILYAADTPHGLVLIGGPGDNIYPAGDIFLLIDVGGDDTYFFDECFHPLERGGHPMACSTVIDLEGDDIYSGGVGVVAGGALGFRTILDLEGRDRYSSDSLGLGAGLMGLGLLVDADGDDHYNAGMFGLGAGAYGIGLLLDGGGDDVYRGAGLCQGFAGPHGMGCLVEESGNDLYYCILTNVQAMGGEEELPGFAQGCTADFQGGEMGGIGLLLDLHGDDNYRCPSQGQGAARGKGVGMLLDVKGYDFYNGRDACQGSGQLGGIGILRDLCGFDSYLALNFSQGRGDAGSVGILIDDAGDDRYIALQSSQGQNRLSGTGMLCDKRGDDRFYTKGDH